MTGSNLAALAANPAIFYRLIQVFVPLRFAFFFTQKYFTVNPLPRRLVPSSLSIRSLSINNF